MSYRSSDPRLILLAFVCEEGSVTWVRNQGTSTVTEIFHARPEMCQFAVTQKDDEFWVVDLYNLFIEPPGLEVHIGTYRAYQTLDAAVMATVMTGRV